MSAHAEKHEHGHGAGHAHHRNYVKIWAILLGLLVVSVVGPMAEIRVITLVTAFGVALVKAYMVAKNFMHLDIEKPIVHWMLALALVLMVLFYSGIAVDVQKHDGHHWKKSYKAQPAPAADHGSGHGGH